MMRSDVYRIILDYELAGIWDWDIENNQVYLSSSFKSMLGYADNELDNFVETWQSMIFPEDLTNTLSVMDEHIASGAKEPFNVTLRYRHKNGSAVWISCKGTVTDWNTENKPKRIVGIHSDITKQKLAEQKLKSTKELLNKTNLSVRLGGWEIDLISNRVAWTRVTKQIYEVPIDYDPQVDELEHFYKPGEHQEKANAALKHLIATGEAYDIEVIMITKTGQEIWVRVSGNAEFKDGKCIKVFGTIQDINEAKSIQQNLKSSEERFKSAFENSPIGMALVSPEGKWLKVNKELANSLGYTADEFAQLTFQQITHPDDLDTDLYLLDKLVAGKIPHYEMEKRYFHKNGNIVWALLSVSLVRDSEGKPLHFVSQVHDITVKKLQDEKIQSTLEIVSEQNNRLLNFAYIVSHNLRTHSGNFQSLIELMNDPNTNDDERHHYITLLENVSKQLDETILNLNDVVSIQANKHLQKMRINLCAYINKTIDTLAADINKYQVKINNRVEYDVEVSYHPAYLESILLNLLTNSIKYRDAARQPQINISFELINNRGVLRISDNGVGIDLKRHGADLFGMYKTFHGNRDAKGIGLFITKNQIEAMGGKIEAESTPGTGTSFTIYLS